VRRRFLRISLASSMTNLNSIAGHRKRRLWVESGHRPLVAGMGGSGRWPTASIQSLSAVLELLGTRQRHPARAQSPYRQRTCHTLPIRRYVSFQDCRRSTRNQDR
jgi:hypothetical protein